jgi:Ras-related protein Rab-1A
MNEYDHILKIILVGDTGVGKSCILTRYVSDQYSAEYISTIGVDFRIRTIDHRGKIVKLQLWDTAGQERFRTITSSYYRGSQGVFLIFDLNSPESLAHIDTWISEIENNSVLPPCYILVGNKSDLRHMVTREEVRIFCAEHQDGNGDPMKYMECSARKGMNTEKLFNIMVDNIVDSLGVDALPIKKHGLAHIFRNCDGVDRPRGSKKCC